MTPSLIRSRSPSGAASGSLSGSYPSPVLAPQGSAYTQTYSTAARIVPDATVAAVDTTAAGLAIFGFAQAQANAIPVAVNALTADVLALKKVLNAVIDDLQASGVLT